MHVVIIVNGKQITMYICVGDYKWNVLEKMDSLYNTLEIIKLFLSTSIHRESSKFSIKLKHVQIVTLRHEITIVCLVTIKSEMLH